MTFHKDTTVVQGFVEGVLDVMNCKQEFTDAVLKDQIIASLVKLLQLIDS